MEGYIAVVSMVAYDFAPKNWAYCNGQLLSIAQNTALFSLLGTTYGGDGQTTFGLPDFRGRVPMNWGQGPGLSPRSLGEQGGSEAVTLLSTQMPAHTHSHNARDQLADSLSPQGPLPAVAVHPRPGAPPRCCAAAPTRGAPASLYSSGSATPTMNPSAIGIAGGSQPHQNMSPFL